MQQQNDNPRFFLFLFICGLILFGWVYLERAIWPPKPRELTASEVIERDSAMLVAGAGIVGDPRIVKLKGEPIPELAEKKPEPKKEVEPVKPVPPSELLALGHSNVKDRESPFYVRVLLNPRGAGIQQVVLTQFQAADREGLPVTDEGEIVPLHLVPGYYRPRSEAMRQPYFPDPLKPGKVPEDVVLTSPSYVLYHYQRSDDDRPVDTLAQQEWKLVNIENTPELETQKAVFEAELGAPHFVKIRKIFTLKQRQYHVGLKVEIERTNPQGTSRFRYQLDGAHQLPIEGEWYTSTYRNAMIGWTDNNGYATRYLEDANTIHFKGGSDRLVRGDKVIRYSAVTNQFFASAIVVDNEQTEGTKQNFIEFVRATAESNTGKQGRLMLEDITVRAISEELPLDQPISHNYLLYQGPIKVRLLWGLENADGSAAVDPALVAKYHDQLKLNTMTDYQMPGPIGSFASTIFWTDILIASTNLMHWVLGGLSNFIPSMGLCILALTVLVRSFLFPISLRQAASASKMQEKMAKVKPELARLQEKYRSDPQRLRQEQMQLYLKHGINPLAMMGGCLLLFLQMPIFMGLYYALQESIVFRLAPFLWIPNLAAPDMLWWWGESIPFVSLPSDFPGMLYLGPYLNILPILAVTLMVIQQRIMMPPAADEQQAAQQSMMKWMMILFGFFFYKVAAGLCLYFIASTAWALTERRFLPKRQLPGSTPIDVKAEVRPNSTGTAAASPPPPPPPAQRDRTALIKGKKDAGKGKGGKGGKGKPAPEAKPAPENPNTTMGKLKAWWRDVLEQARKK